jgi:hypothetical protein
MQSCTKIPHIQHTYGLMLRYCNLITPFFCEENMTQHMDIFQNIHVHKLVEEIPFPL